LWCGEVFLKKHLIYFQRYVIINPSWEERKGAENLSITAHLNYTNIYNMCAGIGKKNNKMNKRAQALDD
jgi:hypothetical protein